MITREDITIEYDVIVFDTEFHIITTVPYQYTDEGTKETTGCKDPAAGNYNPGATHHNAALCWYYGNSNPSE